MLGPVQPALSPSDVSHLLSLSQALTSMAVPVAEASGVGQSLDLQRIVDTRSTLRDGETFSVEA